MLNFLNVSFGKTSLLVIWKNYSLFIPISIKRIEHAEKKTGNKEENKGNGKKKVNTKKRKQKQKMKCNQKLRYRNEINT